MNKHTLLFIKKYNANAKFIINDANILEEKFNVKLYNTKTTSDWKIIFGLISQILFLLFNIFKTKIIYIWFADYHSFLPVLFAKIFGKKSVICAGGYECTFIPEINCGVFTKKSFSKRIRSFCAEYSLKKCSLIIPVDETLVLNTNNYIYSDMPGKAPLIDGIKTFIPNLKTTIETIHLGYDSSFFSPSDNIIRENAVSSAGLIVNEDEFKRKGFDLLLEAAKSISETKFILAGLNEYYLNYIRSLNLPNVEFHGIISYEELINIYRRSKVFAQISMFEGMPSTICEAMLCGCIPIGSDVNGIPKIIGNTGIIIKHKNAGEIVEAINNAIKLSAETSRKAREHIISNFSLQTREAKLLETIGKIL